MGRAPTVGIFERPKDEDFEIVAKTLEEIGIAELKDKPYTEISGGERQRISIARAIMKDSPIIILDEATANVDPENEAELTKAIDELTKNKTIIMIAHRLKTVRHADQIFVISDGRIAQQGTHEELMAREGIYKNFVSERREAASWKIAWLKKILGNKNGGIDKLEKVL